MVIYPFLKDLLKFKRLKIFQSVLASCLLIAFSVSAASQAQSDSAMVVTEHPLATKVGIDILKNGGNAFDAMVAVQSALAVVLPRAGNIAGGGFMVCRLADGSVHSLDFREKAPENAFPDMFQDSLGNVIPGISLYTPLAVGVPGSVEGMFEVNKRFGSMNFADLLEPAIKLAGSGFNITAKQADLLNQFHLDLKQKNGDIVWTSQFPWKEGDLVRVEELAATFKRIQEGGRDGFYKGLTAKYILDVVNAGNGIMTERDLEIYNAVWREPITGKYDSYKLISMAPPSSGGVALIQILEMIEKFPIEKWGRDNKKTYHIIIEAEKRAYADRSKYLGDPDFFNVPISELLDNNYIDERCSDLNTKKATPSSAISKPGLIGNESKETTHYCIVDQFGNAVAVTTTINANYGSGIFVKDAGMFLNNEMDDFSSKPGSANLFGLVGAEANKVEAGKRMLSSMTPTIVEKQGKLFMILGTPGGSTIITSVLQTFLNVVNFQMSIHDAVNTPRFHHQYLPDLVFIEEGAISEKTIEKLKKMGHNFEPRLSIGKVSAILVENGVYVPGEDRRGDNKALGF